MGQVGWSVGFALFFLCLMGFLQVLRKFPGDSCILK